MSILKGLREDHEAIVALSGKWADNLERAAGAGRELNAIKPADTAPKSASQGSGFFGPSGGNPTGADAGGNFLTNPDGTPFFVRPDGSSGAQGTAASASEGGALSYIAHDNGDGKPSPRGPVANISGVVIDGVFHPGVRPPITDASGGLLDILDAQGNSLLALLHAQGSGGQSAGGPALSGGSSAGQTFVGGLTPRGGNPLPTTPPASPVSPGTGGGGGIGGVSAGDRAIIAAIGGLREDLKLNVPLRTLIGAQR